MTRSGIALAGLVTIFVSGCFGRSGTDGHAYTVETPGTGRYEKVKLNIGVIVSDGSIQATIPVRVTEGDQISVEYMADGHPVSDTLLVRRISTKETPKGLLCRLHAAPDRTVGDTVYVKPCKVIR